MNIHKPIQTAFFFGNSVAAPAPAILVVLAILLAAHISGPFKKAHAEVVKYGALELNIISPVGFVDSETISPCLIETNREQTGLGEAILKVYLPERLSQLYAAGRYDAMSRQVAIYGQQTPKGDFDRQGLELMHKSLEGAFSGYLNAADSNRLNRSNLEALLQDAAAKGQSLLVEKVASDNAIGYLTLLVYPKGEDGYLLTAVCTNLVLAKDIILFVTASSLILDGSMSSHILWVRGTAEAFADMLVSANKI